MARIIAFLIFGGFGLVLLYVGVTQFFLQRRLLSSARSIKATITKSEVFTSKSTDTDSRLGRDNSTISHRPDVAFKYQVNNQTYESDLLYPSIIVRSYASRDSAAAELKPFPVGAEVNAFVDPDHPDKAFLIAESSSGPIVFIIIGLLLPPIAWFASKLI